MKQLIAKFIDRKFVMTFLSGFGNWVLMWNEKIGDQVYSVVTIATVATYIAGRAYEAVKAPNEKTP